MSKSIFDMAYLVRILIGPKKGILNPEAIGIKRALEYSLGFEGINGVDIQKSLSYVTNNKTNKLARSEAEELCKKYFADLSVNQDYKIISIEKIKSKQLR
jgi:phosphoribosylformylglycinamidine synthase PurS subunit